MKEHNGMKGQDIAILLYICQYCEGEYKVLDIARSLAISQSEVSESLHRSKVAQLIDTYAKKVFRKSLLEFIHYGIKYVFPVRPGAVLRGIPTAHSAPPLHKKIVSTNEAYVWNSSVGKSRGMSIKPLYKSLPEASQTLPEYYELLCLVDAIRIGKAREVTLAKDILKERLLNAQ